MQLTSLVATSSLVLVALSKTALACNGYLYCHCYNDDNMPNDEATNKTCARYAVGQSAMVPASDASDGAQECHYTGPDGQYSGKAWYPFAFGNCDWRDMCAEAGATGSDSSCRDNPDPDQTTGSWIVDHN